MAIRFQCPSCKQPIEVDGEHAEKLVACPYCRKTVSAPRESTLPDPDVVPLASPLRDPAGMFVSQEFGVAERASTNRLAVVAFALACGVILCFVIMIAVASAHALELEEFYNEVGSAKTMTQKWELMSRMIERYGGQVPGWMIALTLAQMGALATWLAALICGLIAIRRPCRRGLSTAALAVCSLTFLLFVMAGLSG